MSANKMWDKDTITKFWQENESEYAGNITAPEIIRLSKKYLGGRVLDVGAGSGKLVSLINDNYIMLQSMAIGIDIVAKEPFVFLCSIDDIYFEGNSCNVVFCTDTLEHLTREQLFGGIKEIYRILKPNGYFIFTVPYKEKFENSMVTCPKCNTKFHRWGHIQRFDELRIKELLVNNGFKLIEFKVLPLGLMAEHWIIRYFWKIFVRFGFIKANDCFVVAMKV